VGALDPIAGATVAVDASVAPKQPGTGTVVSPVGTATVDSSAPFPAMPGTGTVVDQPITSTVDATGEQPGGKTVVVGRADATVDATQLDPSKITELWGSAATHQGTPGMTVRGREQAPTSEKSTLVIQRRALREPKAADAASGTAEYDLLKTLGQGGMGVVYAARQASIDRTVAVKMLKPNMNKDAAQRSKFLAEAVITGDLDHPNIVPIYDLGANEDGALFYAMKCVRGTPWDKVLPTKGLHENVEILLKVCDAVAFAHSRGVIHRDLKPENTMLGDFGEVLVMDWGLALPFGTFEKSRSITPTAGMGGTPAYMAPEMATGPFERMGPASDVYLLGAILYEIITGRPPHRGKDVMKCLFAAAKNDIVPTEKTGELIDIALKAMATKPEDRYATVQELQAAIRGYQEHSESISMSSRASEELAKAAKSDGYDGYSRALFGFEEAVTLWPRNEKAQQGISQARLSYANRALEKSDYDLGLSLLTQDNPAHTELIGTLTAARREREAKQQRLKAAKRLITALAAGIFAIVTGALVVVGFFYKEADRQRQAAEFERGVAQEQRDLARVAEGEARAAEGVARTAEEVAKTERDNARKAEAEALRQEGIAKDERDKAEYEAYVALIGLASAKIDENAFGHARQLLQQCPPERRNWEWGRLVHMCNQSVQDFAAAARIDAIDIAPDGQRFITGGWDGTARVWSIDGQTLLDLPHPGAYVQAVAFSPTANQVATGSTDPAGYARIWDTATGALLATLRGHTDAVTSVTYSRDGQRLLTTSFDNTARIWDVATGAQLHSLEGHSWWVWDAAFSPDESSIVTVSQDGTALVWSIRDGTRSPPFTGHHGPIYSVAFAPDGKSVVTGGYDKQVLVWRPSDLTPFDFEGLVRGEELPPVKSQALLGHTAAVRTVAFSQDGSLVMSAGHDNTVKLWDVHKGAAVKTLRGHDNWVRACVFSPDGQWVLSGGYDQHARLWSIEGYEEVRVLRGRLLDGHQDAVMAVSFSRDGQQIATASRDRTAKSWDARSGAERVSFREGHAFLASDSVFFSDKTRMLTSAVDNTVRIWDLTAGVELRQLDRTGRAAAVAVSHDDRWLATGSDSRTVKLWNSATGELLRELDGHKVEVTAVAFSHDDRYLFSGDGNGRCLLWDLESGQPLRRLSWHTSQIAKAVFLPDGKRLLTASDDKNVCQWDVSRLAEDPESVVPLESLLFKHPDSVISLDISTDGSRALTACMDGRVRLWDVAAAKLLRELFVANSPVSSAAISRDGKLGLSVHADDRLVRIWNLDTGQALPGGAAHSDDEAFLNFHQLGGLVWSARFTDDASAILTVGGNEARLWDLRRETTLPRELMTFSPHAAVASVNFSPDGRRLVTASWDNSARIWDASNGHALLKLVGGHSGYVNSAVFSPDGQWVLTASDDHTAKLWDAASGKVVRSFEGHSARVHAATFSRDGQFVLTASEDKTARIWNAQTAELVRELRGHQWGVLSAGFSTDGRLVITGSDDNTARIWNAQTGETLQTLAGHTAAVTAVAFSPDSRRALTASEDFTARLWDAETGKEILNLRGHSQEVTSVTFSDDGHYALTGSRDGTAILWLTTPWENSAAQP